MSLIKVQLMIYYWESKVAGDGVPLSSLIMPMVKETLELLRELEQIKKQEVTNESSKDL